MKYNVKTTRQGAAPAGEGKAPTTRRKYTGGSSRCDGDHSRTAFALKVYREIADDKRACQLVVADIYRDLHDEMRSAGWVRNQVGYTEGQLNILTNYYKEKGRL